MPQLGQGEHGALLHLELHARVVHQLGEPARRGLAGRLTEPEDGRAPGLARQRTRTGETQQVGPDGDAVRQDGRENGVVVGVAGSARGEVEQIAGGDRGRDGAEIGDSGVHGRSPGAAHVGPHPGDPPADLPECDPRRPWLTRAPRLVVVVVARGDAMPAAGAVVALERDRVAAVAAHAGSGGEGKAHVAVRRRSDPVGQGALKGEGERQDRRSDHWLMISSSTCAARGSCDWPSQKIAFLRSSLSCSVLAIWMRRSTAAASWRCEYTKMSCSFRAISMSQRLLSASCICESEKITFSLSSSSVSLPYSPRRKAAFSPECCWPSQKMAFSRASDGALAFSA